MSRFKKNCPEKGEKEKKGFFSQKNAAEDKLDEKPDGNLGEKLDQMCSYAREIRDEIKGVRDQVGKNTDAIAANRKDIEAIKAFVGMPGSVPSQSVPAQAQTQTSTQSQQAPVSTPVQPQQRSTRASVQSQPTSAQAQTSALAGVPVWLPTATPTSYNGVYCIDNWMTVKAANIDGRLIITR